MLPRFVEKTATEKAVLSYQFSMSGDELFCREAYENAGSKCTASRRRLEKLKKPLAHLKPAFFTLEASAGKVKIKK